MDKFVEEYKVKMILVNKYLDEQNITSFKDRKYAYLKEMEKATLKIDWDAEILAYYKSLPYHDEVNIMLDGKHVVIPKKTGLEPLIR
jgi:hypothetical protein